MIEKILDTLYAADNLSGWQVRERRQQSCQLFLNGRGAESRRIVENLSYEIEVLVDHLKKEGGKTSRTTGSSRFAVDKAGLGRFEEDLKEAVFAANLAENEAFRLPDPGPFYPTPPLKDPALAKDPAKELEGLAGRLRDAVAKTAKARLSAAEFFADSLSLRHFNSQGIQSAQETTLLSSELVLLLPGPDGEAEAFRAVKTRRAADFDVEAEAAEAARLADMRARAALPATGSADVVFRGAALDHLFDWFTAQASASAKYNRLSARRIGDVLAAPRPGASPLTIWHNAVLPWATGSYYFDGSGVAGKRHLLVENGVLRNYWASSRFAQYLKIPASGELGTLEVFPGETPEAEMLKPSGSRRLIEVFEFSYFEPNPVTGEFSGEIRAALETGLEGARPIKGGSVSGSSETAFENAWFSKETCAREGYWGPRAVRLEGLTIAGS